MAFDVQSRTEMEHRRLAITGTVTISSGKGISDAEALEGRAVVRIATDAKWNATTAPSMSLMVSEDGTTFKQLRVWHAATPTTTIVAAVTVNTSLSYSIPADWTNGAHSVKVVSGTVATSKPIAKNRTVTLVYRLV